MTAKEYLLQAHYLDIRIDSKLKELTELRSLAMKVTSAYSNTPHTITPDNRRLEKILAGIVDLEKEIDTDIDNFVDLQREIKTTIEEVKDEKYKALLEMRYLNQMTWEQIAVKLGYDLRYTYKIHGRALQKISVPEKKDTKRH